MNQAAHGIGSNHTQEPEHYQNHADCPQHNIHPLYWLLPEALASAISASC
jgi:hypothetical protein